MPVDGGAVVRDAVSVSNAVLSGRDRTL